VRNGAGEDDGADCVRTRLPGSRPSSRNRSLPTRSPCPLLLLNTDRTRRPAANIAHNVQAMRPGNVRRTPTVLATCAELRARVSFTSGPRPEQAYMVRSVGGVVRKRRGCVRSQLLPDGTVAALPEDLSWPRPEGQFRRHQGVAERAAIRRADRGRGP